MSIGMYPIMAVYIASVAAIFFGAATKFNLPAFLLGAAMSLGFAIIKGSVLGYGFCPIVHVFVTLILSLVAGEVLGAVRFTEGLLGSSSNSDGTGCLSKIILGALVLLAGPLLAYSLAANLTMRVMPSCTDMFREDLKDIIPY